MLKELPRSYWSSSYQFLPRDLNNMWIKNISIWRSLTKTDLSTRVKIENTALIYDLSLMFKKLLSNLQRMLE